MTNDLNIPIGEDKWLTQAKEMVNNDTQTFQVEQKESIKLSKMSKGYNWEIKLLEINLKRLDEINQEMVNKYGGEKQ